MSDTIDLMKLIELKRILDEKFGLALHIHDSCGGQYFSVDEVIPSAQDIIKFFFEKEGYRAVFTADGTEFYIEEVRTC